MLLRFNYFLHNDFSLLLMLFWLFSMALTSFSYCLSVLVKKPQVCAVKWWGLVGLFLSLEVGATSYSALAH